MFDRLRQTKLSRNFSLWEMIRSETAIRKNYTEQFDPPLEVIENLKNLCLHILQPCRNALGPINVVIGYRCKRVNTDVKGAPNSQHIPGEASDLEYYLDGVERNELLFKRILDLKLPFDQLIWEFGDTNAPAWVHVSYGPRNRRQILRAIHVPHPSIPGAFETKYIPFDLKI